MGPNTGANSMKYKDIKGGRNQMQETTHFNQSGITQILTDVWTINC